MKPLRQRMAKFVQPEEFFNFQDCLQQIAESYINHNQRGYRNEEGTQLLSLIDKTEAVSPDPVVPDKLHRNWHTPCFDNLNKLEWVEGFGVQSHGVRTGIRVSDPELIPVLRKRLPVHVKPYTGAVYDNILSVIKGGKEPGSRLRKFHMVYQNHTPVGRSHRLEEVLDGFDAYFALMTAFMSPKKVFLHAGVVGVNGQAIIIPGKSHSGKSTLVSELVRAGATYYSDEYAVLDNRGRVFPWHKPISMREHAGAKQVDVPISEFGGKAGHRSLAPGLVVLTEYKENARWRPKQLSAGASIFGMLENSVGGRFAPERTLSALEIVADQAMTIKSKRGEAGLIVQKIFESLGQYKY